MNAEIYQIVRDAIEQHALDCRCYICEAFVNEENGSKGHAAACSAVAERLYGDTPRSVADSRRHYPKD